MPKERFGLRAKLKFVLRFVLHLVILLCVCVLVSMAYYTDLDLRTLVRLQLDFIWITVGVALAMTWMVRKF